MNLDTRSTLIDVATSQVRRQGYSAFSYADLADAVGIRKPSIHHHFPTKEDLGVAIVAAYTERFSGELDRIDAETGKVLERLRAYARLYREGLESGKGACAACWRQRWLFSRNRSRRACDSSSLSTCAGSSGLCAMAARPAPCVAGSFRSATPEPSLRRFRVRCSSRSPCRSRPLSIKPWPAFSAVLPRRPPDFSLILFPTN